MNWFRPHQQPAPVLPLAPTPYHQRMAESRDTLHWLVKKKSDVISTTAYSEIRELERTLKEINRFVETHDITAADEHMLDSIMKDYLPSSIELFCKLSALERAEGGEGEGLFLQQCRTMATDLRNRLSELHDRAKKDLKVQADFIESKFSQSNLDLTAH